MNPVLTRIGTRRSALAKIQSQGVLDSLALQGLPCALVEIDSQGDQDLTTPLYEIEGASPGLFTKQLEVALLNNEIDVAVHSLKDLPTALAPGLRLAAVSRREAAGDCLILSPQKRDPGMQWELPRGARVGTSSLRREAQLQATRPDLDIVPLRGNVPTRVKSVLEGKCDAVLLAQAGLNRLGLDLHGLLRLDLPSELFLPAPGQGALGIETRTQIPPALALALGKIHDIDADEETRVERRVLQALHGGCTLPLGVLCRRVPGGLHVRAFLGVEDVRGVPQAPRKWRAFLSFEATEPEEEPVIGTVVAHLMKEWDRVGRIPR